MQKTAVLKLPLMLKELKLPIISNCWQEMAELATSEGWSYEEFLAAISEQELNNKIEKRIARKLKESKIDPIKNLSNFDFKANSSINKQQILALANNTSWVKNAENLVLLGPSGVGKTHISMAICNNLIEKGIRVLFVKTMKLVQELQLAKSSYNLAKAIDKLNRYELLILDDMGYVKKDNMETSVLFELIAERYERRSLIITCNQPFSEWGNIFSDNAMTIAAVDRVVHHATIINLKGESFRQKSALKKVKEVA